MNNKPRKKLAPGTMVIVQSKRSMFKGERGRVRGYCHGRFPENCWVELESGRIIKFCDYKLLPVDEDTSNVPSPKVNTVTVRWFDDYLEEFEATEVRFGSDILFLRLVDGKNRHIPLRQVRWFGMSVESHQNWEGQKSGCESMGRL